MRKTRLLLAAAVTCGLTTATLIAADQMTVQVKRTQVRDTPSYLGKLVAELRYGDRVTILEKGPAWLKIQSKLDSGSKTSGYLHKSTLTTRQLTLTAGTASQVDASEEELALAGSGFNEDIEQRYRNEHRDLDAAFEALDHMRGSAIFNPKPQDLRAFLAQGGVEGGER